MLSTTLLIKRISKKAGFDLHVRKGTGSLGGTVVISGKEDFSYEDRMRASAFLDSNFPEVSFKGSGYFQASTRFLMIEANGMIAGLNVEGNIIKEDRI